MQAGQSMKHGNLGRHVEDSINSLRISGVLCVAGAISSAIQSIISRAYYLPITAGLKFRLPRS